MRDDNEQAIDSSCAVSRDGRKVAIGGLGGAAIFDAETGTQRVALSLRYGLVSKISFSGDSRYVLTLQTGGPTPENIARIWDASSGKEVFAARSNLGPITSAEISPNSRWLATASFDVAQIWQLSAGRVHTKIHGHDDEITSVRFSGDGQRLSAGAIGRTVT